MDKLMTLHEFKQKLNELPEEWDDTIVDITQCVHDKLTETIYFTPTDERLDALIRLRNLKRLFSIPSGKL